MTPTPFRAAILACALALAAASGPTLADSIVTAGSSVGSSASSAGSASLKGSSNSIEGSSSSRGDKTAMVHDGTYRVTAVTPDEQAATVRIGLVPQAMAGAEAFVLNVPVGAFGGQVPTTGELLQAQRRPYGVQFARADRPFYLVLADAWNAELDARPLTP